MPDTAVKDHHGPDAPTGGATPSELPPAPEQVSPIIISKVQPPVVPRGLVERDRLVGWLKEKTAQRLVVVTAEAGYGKTTRLTSDVQVVLIYASLLDQVKPDLVAAALSVAAPRFDHSVVVNSLQDVESMGLVSASQDHGEGFRIHPLLRQFLRRQLSELVDEKALAAIHLAIARTAEKSDWLTSGKHYAAASEADSAVRVLSTAATQVLGSGAWGAALEVVEGVHPVARPAAVEIVRARALAANGDPERALELLHEIDQSNLTAADVGLLTLAEASAYHGLGARLHYFAGVSYHNAASGEAAMGNYEAALRLASQAMAVLRNTEQGATIASAVQLVAAWATCELGDWRRGVGIATEAARRPSAPADVVAEAAYLSAVTGDTQETRFLLATLDSALAAGARDLGVAAMRCYAQAAYAVARGDLAGLRLAIQEIKDAHEPDAPARKAVLMAHLGILEAAKNRISLARDAVRVVEAQLAWRWTPRVRLLLAASTEDPDALRLWIDEAAARSPFALLELADVVAMSLGFLKTIPNSLEESVVQNPSRWIPALSRQLQSSNRQAAASAAELVAQYGEFGDLSGLKDYDQSSSGNSRKGGFGATLIRRVSPTARVHDLGPTSYTIGKRAVQLSDKRRRPASLLLYLVARPRLSATKEQVMDGLWPEQGPDSALNSLHQTLFFLRRDIEPWYEEGWTADYVRMQSDMVFLDPEMFQVDSVAFTRQASDLIAAGTTAKHGPALLSLYSGRFAPEFEYDQWAEDWRNHVHTSYLHLAHETAASLLELGDGNTAIQVLSNAVVLDPMAFSLRGVLVGALEDAGASDAALSHYEHYAAAYRSELGAEPPTLLSLRVRT